MSRTILYSKVLDIKVSLASNDPFGAVRSGTLTMCCSGMLVGYLSGKNAIKIELGNHMFVFTSHADQKIPVRLDPLVNQDNDEDNVHSTVSKDEGKSDRLCENDQNKEQGLSADDIVYLLPICAEFEGIILKSTKGSPGQFNRIGHFRNTWGLAKTFATTFKKRGRATAESVAAEIIENPEDSDMRYVITIV